MSSHSFTFQGRIGYARGRIPVASATAFAIAAAGIYAMAFSLTGACYDVGRPDSMMLMLTFAGLATLRFTRGMP